MAKKLETGMAIALLTVLLSGIICVCSGSDTYAAETAYKPGMVRIIKSSINEDYTIEVSWKRAKHAKKYEVYIKDCNFNIIIRLNRKGTKAIVRYLAPGTKYLIKVRGINGKRKGRWSKCRNIKTAGDPAAEDVASDIQKQVSKFNAAKINSGNSKKIKFTWGRLSKVNYYNIYYKTSKGSYKLLKGKISGTKASYTSTVTKFKKERYCWFRIKPYSNKGAGKNSKSVKVKIK